VSTRLRQRRCNQGYEDGEEEGVSRDLEIEISEAVKNIAAMPDIAPTVIPRTRRSGSFGKPGTSIGKSVSHFQRLRYRDKGKSKKIFFYPCEIASSKFHRAGRAHPVPSAGAGRRHGGGITEPEPNILSLKKIDAFFIP